MGEKQKRVRRHKLERKFMTEVSRGRNYTLGDYRKLEEEEHEKIFQRCEQTAVMSPRREGRRERGGGLPIEVMHEFPGAVRCLEATQGGTTLWAGEIDGTTSIRNGATGEIVHHIPGTGGVYVDSLHATESHMWVGCSDGTVRIYDHLVYVHVCGARYHEASVSCFASTFDGKVFSASIDTNIIKWDTEANKFEVMAKLSSSSPQPIHCITCYGYNLFVGGEDHVIRCLDTETVQLLRTFQGHTAPVRSILVQDGYLFSGAMDGCVCAWNMEHGECIFTLADTSGVAHSSAVTAIAGDPVGHNIWTADQEGIIKVWDSRPVAGFNHLRTLESHHSAQAPSRIVVLKSLTTVDAVKLWSVNGANGLNSIWYTEVNRVEDSVRGAVDVMDSIINQDTVELAKWKELIRKLNAVDERRKEELSNALGRLTDTGLAVTYLHKLARYRAFHRARLRCRRIASGELVAADHALRYRFYRKLQAFAQVTRASRRRTAVSAVLRQQSHRWVQLAYWRKIQGYARHRRKLECNGDVAANLAGRSGVMLMRLYWPRLLRLAELRARMGRRRYATELLLSLTERGVRRVAYSRLQGLRLQGRYNKLRGHFASIIFGQSERVLLQQSYNRLARYPATAGERKIRKDIAERLSGRLGLGLRRKYYDRWVAHRASCGGERIRQWIEDEKMVHQGLKEDWVMREATLSRLSEVTAKEREVDVLRAEVEQKRAQVVARLGLLDKLRAEMEEKRRAREQAEELSAKQKKDLVDDVMAGLKAKALNYSFDFKLIEKIRDAARRDADGARGAYLKAHIGVKRVVIDLTKCEQEPGQRWRKLDGVIGSIPDHHKLSILKEIKIMCICYDLLTAAQKASLDTDDEIILNEDGRGGKTKYLSRMVDIGKECEDKRLRRA